MDSTPLSSRSPSPYSELTHSFGEVLRERAGIPERAPRIKIGDQYYHVVRIVGGHYEAPISEVESLVKTGAIGESFFLAHKKYAEATPELQGQKILYANDEGVRYENGMLVRNVDVRVDAEDSMNYLKATDNIEWQDEVLRYETHLDTLAPTDSISRVPPYLHRIATSGRNYGPYTVQQVKGFLLEYTREKLAGAHEIYSTMHSSPEMQELQKHDERQWIEKFPTATTAINESRNYFQAGYLRTNNLWQMMVRTMQPGEFRLLPEEEALDHTSLPFASSEPIDIPRGRERYRSSSLELPHTHNSHSPLHSESSILRSTPVRSRSTHVPPLDLGRSHQSSLHPRHPVADEFHRTETLPPVTSYIPSRKREDEVHSPSPSLSDGLQEIDLSSRLGSPRSDAVVPFVDPHASKSVGRGGSIPRVVQESSSLRRQPRKLEFYEQADFRERAGLYPQLRLIASNPPAEHVWESREATKAACRSAHTKMERNAEPGEYTAAERHALHQVIQKKESAGGFGLLMAGSKYQSVSKSLAFYAGIGLI